MHPEGGTFEIQVEIDNGSSIEEVTWYYSPSYRGWSERIDTDDDIKNPIGILILGLLQEFLTRESPITSKMMKEVEKSCDELEELL